MHFILVIGVLEGGHIFLYDVCADDLCLIMGRPEISQFFNNGKLSDAEEKENRAPTINEDKSDPPEQFQMRNHFTLNSGFIKQSVKVKSTLESFD